MQGKTNIILVTGFLGAGKTTFLNRLIQLHSGSRLGIIVNDFGEVAVDGDLIKANPFFQNDKEECLIEIANGSIFCSCLKSAFLDGLKHYALNPPDFLLIETSGISDPTSMERLLTSDPLFAKTFHLQKVFCLVDAISFLDLVDHFIFIENQLSSSDIAIISKSDQVDKSILNQIHQKISGFNPDLAIIETTRTNIDRFEIRAGQSDRDRPAKPSIQKTRAGDGFHSPVAFEKPRSFFLSQKSADFETMIRFLRDMQKHVYRLKGFLKDNRNTYYIDGTNRQTRIEQSNLNPEQLGISVFSSESVKETMLADWSEL